LRAKNTSTPTGCLEGDACWWNEENEIIVEEENKETVPKTQKIHKVKNLTIEHAHECQYETNHERVELVNDTIKQFELDSNSPFVEYNYQVSPLLTLNILSKEVPINFWQTLSNRLAVVVQLYEEMFELKLQQPQELNIVIINGRDEYLALQASLNYDASKSIGTYWRSSNTAFVENRDNTQVIQTSMHESVHGLNAILVGKTSRFINEGLATFFQRLTIDNGQYVYTKDKDYGPDVRYLDLNSVASSSLEWDGNIRNDLYFSSFLNVSYLMDHQHEANLYTNYLQKRSVNHASR
jgi:hypothetical protein